jgi:hypothetical protein
MLTWRFIKWNKLNSQVYIDANHYIICYSDPTRNYISGNIPEEWASMKHLTNL